MIYIGYFLLSFIFLRLAVALVNLISNIYLPPSIRLQDGPKVSILIPARNEAANIGLVLTDIINLSYHNYEVFVYNDCSTDNTAKIVQKIAAKNTRIQLIEGNPPSEGWLGKNFACHNLALQATGDYVLFLDADVRVGSNLLDRALLTAGRQRLKLLSVFPQQIINNKGTLQVVPLMNWILLSLLPLILVRLSGWTSFSAANGQFMLFEAKTYRDLLPHQEFKKSKVEDIAICRYYKKKKMRVASILGDADIRCKMYNTKQEAIDGFSKNIFAFFGNSIAATLLFAVLTTFSPLLLYILLDIEAALLYLFAAILIRICIAMASHQPIIQNIKYVLQQHYAFLTIIYTALIHRRNRSLEWKGRSISDSL